MVNCCDPIRRKLAYFTRVEKTLVKEKSDRKFKIIEQFGRKKFIVTEVDGCTATYQNIRIRNERGYVGDYVKDFETFEQFLNDPRTASVISSSESYTRQKDGWKLNYERNGQNCKAYIFEPSGWARQLLWTEPHKIYAYTRFADMSFKEFREYLRLKEEWLKNIGIEVNAEKPGKHGGKIRSFYKGRRFLIKNAL